MNMQEDNLFETPEPKRRYSPSMYFPVFDPAVDGVRHPMCDLAGTSRYKEALRMVDEKFAAGSITQDEYEFFKMAATRFIEFNFTAIAEQYCVSSPAARDLYESLCLVYVSTTKAIMNALIDCDASFREYVDSAIRHFDNKEPEAVDSQPQEAVQATEAEASGGSTAQEEKTAEG